MIPVQTAMETLSSLLPAYGLTLRFQLKAPLYLGFYHQPVIRGWLNTLFPKLLDGERRVWIHAPESGRAKFEKGEIYRLQLFCCKGGEGLLEKIARRLEQPVMLAAKAETKPEPRLNDQLAFEGFEDWLTAKPLASLSEVGAYDEQSFRREIEFWSGRPELRLRLISPIRILLPPALRRDKKGEARYVRDRGQMPRDLLIRRIADSIQAILEDNAIPFTVPATPETMRSDKLFWIDYHYGEAPKPMGGLLGSAELRIPEENRAELLPYLVLGQLFGVGQRRTFGWGRYRLETPDRQGTAPLRRFSRSILERAAQIGRLEQASLFILAQRRTEPRNDDEDAYESEIEAQIEAECAEDPPSGPDLEELSRLLLGGEYEVPVLEGGILRKPEKPHGPCRSRRYAIAWFSERWSRCSRRTRSP